jgi:hypothetical protein
MNVFKDAIISNNHGVKLLESNDTVLAIAAFQSGIQLLKEFGESRYQNQTFASDKQNDQTLNQECSPSCAMSQSYQFLLNDHIDMEGCPRGLYYSYNRPMLLPADVTSSLQVFDSQMYLISSVLLFNLALTYQKHANQSCVSNSIQREVKIYTLAASVLEHGGCDNDCSKLMMILILNNLANLHYELCDYEISHYLFNCIKQFLSSDAAAGDFATSFLNEEEWTELQLNCVYSHIPPAASTA